MLAYKKPHIRVSENNSLRYANIIKYNNSSNLKNDFNTLSCDAFSKDKKYKELQLFKSSATITTQFETNYNNLKAEIFLRGSSSKVDVPIIKRTKYISVKSKLDAKIYNLTNGKSGIYFTSGNIFDYDYNTIIGLHNYNGKLPKFAYSSNYLKIIDEWFLIENVIYDDLKKAQVIIIDKLTTLDEDIIVSSLYDENNFETYEFQFDAINYINKDIRVLISFKDTRFSNVYFLSEFLRIKTEYDEKTVDITYSNKSNNDIDYRYGIKNKLTLKINNVKGSLSGNVETNKFDTKTVLSSSSAYKEDLYEFLPVTKMFAYKIAFALMHDIVHINNVRYVASDVPEISILGNSNLYIVKAKMIVAENMNSVQMSQVTSFIKTKDNGVVKWIEY